MIHDLYSLELVVLIVGFIITFIIMHHFHQDDYRTRECAQNRRSAQVSLSTTETETVAEIQGAAPQGEQSRRCSRVSYTSGGS